MKWNLVKAGCFGAAFGIAAIFFQQDVPRIYVEYGIPTLTALILGGAFGGMLLFSFVAAVRNIFG